MGRDVTDVGQAWEIERAAGRNLLDLVEAINSVAPELGAAAEPCGDGIAAYIGSGSPLTTVKGLTVDIGEDGVAAVEAFFGRHGAGAVTFELAPMASPVWQALVRARAVLPDTVCFSVRDRELGDIACAQIDPAEGIAIFGNDATLPAARGRGAQSALIRARLHRAADLEFRFAIAEVAPGSTSERNYLRAGFGIVATRAHFRRELA